MKLFNISEALFDGISKKGFELSTIFLLEKAILGMDTSIFESARVKGQLSTLVRKGYLNEDFTPTSDGKELYTSLCYSSTDIKVKKIEKKDDEWKKFLSVYPPNNMFVWKGKIFEGDRGIKNNTKNGESLFTKILNDKEYSCDDLCKAVMAEAINKMEQSYKTGENKMRYFINTESWLRQKQYENWVDIGRTLTEDQIEQYKAAYKRDRKKTAKAGYGGLDI